MNKKEEFIGYLINVGVTTCRLFGVKSDQSLKELHVNSYSVLPEQKEYFDKVISEINDHIVKTISNELLVKVIVDSKFADLFETEVQLKEFIRKFYIKTNLYFNIITKSQTEKNLEMLFGKLDDDTAIINIGRNYIDILVIKGNKIDSVSIEYSLRNLEKYMQTKAYGEVLSNEQISEIKAKIFKEIKNSISDINVTKSIIIKNELQFMKLFEYPLKENSEIKVKEHQYSIDIESYKRANREKLFCVDLKQKLNDMNIDSKGQDRLYGFKNGHLLLETIFEKIGVQTIIPSDLLNIHGNINCYIYKVVLSGSTKEEHKQYFFKAATFIKELGGKILSPQFNGKELLPITTDTVFAHFSAIDDCDILFVCNKDGYIGDSTAIEIGYASALRKTIVFWKEPPEEDNRRLYCIPHENWKNIDI